MIVIQCVIIWQKGDGSLRQDEKRIPDVSRIRREAGGYLAMRSNRMLLILATVTVLSSVLLYVALHGVYSAIMMLATPNEMLVVDHTAYITGQIIYAVYIIAIWLLTLLVTVPLFFGLFYMAMQIVTGKEIVFLDVFHSFSSASAYRRAVRLSVSMLWRATLTLLIAIWTFRAAIALSGGSVAIALLGAVFIVLEIVVALLLSAKYFYAVYLVYTDESVSVAQAREKSCVITEQDRSAPIRYTVDYLPWLILSVLTAGILLIADTLPRMLVSYFRFAEATFDRFNQSEEIKNYE